MGYYQSRSYTFTSSGTGTIEGSSVAVKSYSIQVKGTGAAATAWDVDLEGSLDGVNFTQILNHTTTTGDGKILFSGSNIYPAYYIRPKVNSLTLGSASNIVVEILGTD